ncbi:thioesterase II family protein [Streptomyces sp. NPDC012751]|uniref:thioesterase II family protein n=1 Tax=unclassified Streptomyces TaxID=2593676 RepID=UPI0004CC1BB2|nr:alpha/beta fold hydrolase [Streptomyces sp. NRRL S-31]
MSRTWAGRDLCVCFPAAGGGGAPLDLVRDAAARLGLATLALPNAESVADLDSGRWGRRTVEAIRRAADRGAARRIVLAGHSMGGLSAIRLLPALGVRGARPIGVLVINTPCPDSSGRIPTMSRLPDPEIARILAHDGFPQEVLDDEDMLAEVAHGLRSDTVVADRLAERFGPAGRLTDLHVLCGRDDRFIPPERCAAWARRVSGEFHLTVVPGGHSPDTTWTTALDRALAGVLAATPAEEAAA